MCISAYFVSLDQTWQDSCCTSTHMGGGGDNLTRIRYVLGGEVVLLINSVIATN